MTIENPSIQTCVEENEIEINRRRIELFNDPNYGIVLAFLDKYRSILDLPIYPLQLLEDHLVNYQGENPPRLIDFYFTLLKRLSIAKNAQREKFDSIISKFASRFETTDLLTHGYLQADIHIKIRILKNLLESQFDLNQNFRNILSDQSSSEIKSLPTGRDRFGASYWCFIDNNGFVRLFREDIDIDRTWTIVAKNQDEFERFIKLLITDYIVQKRFSDWTIDYQPFSSLSPSNEFEQYYSPRIPQQCSIDNQEENEVEQISTDEKVPDSPVKRKRGRPRASGKLPIKKEEEEMQVVTRSRKRSFDEDDISLAIRSQKVSAIKPVCKTKPQKKLKVSNNRHRRRKSISSSSDDQIDNLTEDEYNSDDYLPTPSPLDVDDHFFDLDDEIGDEQIRSAKTAKTSTEITICSVCSKSDQPEVLLLCDGCNDAYHLECLHPQLLSVPEGDWYCPLCEHKQLSNNLIEKFKELLINNYHPIEFELEVEDDQQSNSNLSSSSYVDENQNNISQRGRYRRTRFDLKKMLDDHFSDSNDEQQITDFHVELPKKITRLLHRRDRNTEQQMKTVPTRLGQPSMDANDPSELNEKLGSPLVYVTSDGQCRQMKSVITNSKQTLQIVRRWNDVQRRSRLRLSSKIMTSDYIDENSNLCLDDPLPIHDDDNSKINVVQSTTVIPLETYSPKNMLHRVDANFDRLTRDIQFAVNEAHLLTNISEPEHIKRIPKKFSSPFMTKNPFLFKT